MMLASNVGVNLLLALTWECLGMLVASNLLRRVHKSEGAESRSEITGPAIALAALCSVSPTASAICCGEDQLTSHTWAA